MGDLGPGTRRSVLIGAAAGMAVTAAGCGGPTRAKPPGSPSPSPAGRVGIRAADIPVDGGKIFPDPDPGRGGGAQPAPGPVPGVSATRAPRGRLLAARSDR